MSRVAALLCVLGVLGVAPARGADEPFFLRDGDRVVFYGDSITQQRLYTRYVQQYVYARYPERNVRFWNAGWGGDTAKGANRRMLRDVLELRPTVVTLLFGMNDGRYRPITDDKLASYTSEMKQLCESLVANGARVVVITPGCVDYDKNPGLGPGKYNETLAALAGAARKVARETGCRLIDLHAPMLAFQTSQKKDDAEFTMIPDGVHPSPPGQLFMAHTILKGLGAERMPPLGSADLRNGKESGLRVVESVEGRYVLETTGDRSAPVWFPREAIAVAESCGFVEKLAGQTLTVKGIKPGRYELTVDGQTLGEVEPAEMARGRVVSGRWSTAAKLVHDLVERKENHYYATWRDVRLPYEDAEGVDATVRGLMEADDGYHGMIRAQCTPQEPIRIELERVPKGVNVARGRTYECSDPNEYDWGGGLTDGSWLVDREHCFATGDDRRFPKRVTVDLGKTQRIGAIRFGVPPYGATRSVTVSVGKNGKVFTDVGEVEFELRKEQRETLWLEPVSARFVRLTYTAQHTEDVGFPRTYALTTELEVYPPR